MKKTEEKKEGQHRPQRNASTSFSRSDGLLAETEDSAIKEIIADQIKVAMDKQRSQQDRDGRAHEDQPPAARSAARSGQSVGDAGDAAASSQRGRDGI